MTYTVKIIDGQPQRIIRKTVHKLQISDVEDPEIYIAEPMWKWRQSEQGKWVMNHAIEPPMYLRQLDNMTYGYTYVILADLLERDAIYYSLKWE